MCLQGLTMKNLYGILAAALAAAAVLSGGCRTISKGITESVLEHGPAREWRVHYGSRISYTITNETMKEIEFEGDANAVGTTVRYQRGLAQPARCIADKTAELLALVQERTGVTISTRSTIYLLRFDQRPQNFDIMLTVEPNMFPLPLFVHAGDESCEAILAQNRSYPYLFVHEVVETSLAGGEDGALVLPDLSWGLLGLNLHVNNYTRWFRDGLANYAGLIAYEALADDIPDSERLDQRELLLHTNPFSSLRQVGDRLFSWPQSSRTGRERAYYNAALGLFLLMEDLYGRDAIHRVMDAIADREAVDGRDLVEVTNRTLGTDVKRLAEEFELPWVGVELERLTPAAALNAGIEPRAGLLVVSVKDGGPGGKAGLKAKDIITAVASRPAANLLDFELALFRARRQSTVSLTVQRGGTETLTLELPLQMARPDEDEQTRRPGDRKR